MPKNTKKFYCKTCVENGKEPRSSGLSLDHQANIVDSEEKECEECWEDYFSKKGYKKNGYIPNLIN